MRRFGQLVVTTAVAGLLALAMSGPASAQAAPSAQDQQWMVAAHQSNLAEIAAGTAAQQQATRDDVKELGRMFVEMHTALDADLTAAATSLGVALPGAPTPQQQQELAAVAANQGAAFDNAWIAQQLTSHRTTLAATEQELAQGSDQTVLGLARASTPVVQQHIQSLEQAQQGGGDLPFTGPSNATTLALIGLLVFALGLVVLGTRRRPRTA